jgi:hypothetical protein
VKKRWIILIVLVLLIAFGWYNFFVPHGSARKRLAEYKKELIAKGEKLDLMSFVPTLPPGVSNGAPAFLGVITNWMQPNNFPSMMRMVGPGVAAIGHTNLGPIDMAGYETNKAIAKELRAILGASILYFDLNYSNAPKVSFFHVMYVKYAAMLFYHTSLQALCRDDVEEAVSDIGAGADVVRLYGNEHLEISTLVRIACAINEIASAWECLQRNGWSDSQLATLQSKWAQIDLFSNMDLVLQEERALSIVELAAMRHATNAALLNPLANMPGTSSNPTFGDWLGDLFKDPKAALKDAYERYPKFWMWKSSWSYEEELCGLQMIAAGIESCHRIKALGFCAPALAELSTQTSNIFKSYPKTESHFLAGLGDESATFHRVLVKAALTETARRLLITAIALKRFHLRHGKWPNALDELVPDFLAKVPIDFMDGKPLRYKFVNTKRYLLYSVGADGKDDGGDGSPADSTMSVRFLGGRDIVWPQPAAESEILDFQARTAKPTNAPSAMEPK